LNSPRFWSSGEGFSLEELEELNKGNKNQRALAELEALEAERDAERKQ
jgi:hypothetical protein